MKDWFNILLKHLSEKIRDSGNPSKAHLEDHARRVWSRCRRLSEMLGGDIVVLAGASALHDLARHDGLVVHGEASAMQAKPILKREGFPEEKIAGVLEAIRLHDYQRDPGERESIESQILYDADKMDAFGPAGVKRYILYYWGECREDVDVESIIEDNLKVKYGSLHLEESKRMAGKDYMYILEFFTRLGEVE